MVNTDVVADPRGVVMVIGPVVAVAGTVATSVGGVAWNVVDGVPLNTTDVTPAENPIPVKVTCELGQPDWGANDNNSKTARRTWVIFPAGS
jgi:hypothetical protein